VCYAAAHLDRNDSTLPKLSGEKYTTSRIFLCFWPDNHHTMDVRAMYGNVRSMYGDTLRRSCNCRWDRRG
jgi:hypothetical protein